MPRIVCLMQAAAILLPAATVDNYNLQGAKDRQAD